MQSSGLSEKGALHCLGTNTLSGPVEQNPKLAVLFPVRPVPKSKLLGIVVAELLQAG